MDEKYTNAFIDSSIQYLFKLRKLAKRDPVTLRDLSLLEVFLQVYNWADWYEVSETDKIHIQKLLDCIYLRNSNLVLPTVIPGVFYSNVSTPQTIWTWQRIWDNFEVNTTDGTVPGIYYISVTPSSTIQPATSGSTVFGVSANTTWTATSNQPWCSVSISGNNIIATYTTNILASSRMATITVSDTGGHSVTPKTVTLTQSAAVATFTVTPSVRTVSASEGTTTFAVTSNSSWTVTSDSAWCTATPSGSGNGTINVTYAQNFATSARSAYLTVTVPGLAPVQVRVIQDWSNTYLNVTPSLRSVSTVAATTTFAVASNTTWTVALVGTTTDWCSVTPSGSNNGTITVTYGQNTNVSSRSVTVRVTAPNLPVVDVVVTQAGVSPTLAVAPASMSMGSSGGTSNFTVTSNSAWLASSNAVWCTVTPSGAGNAGLFFTATANTLGSPRTATITVTVSGLTPVQVTVVQDAYIPPIGEFVIHQGYIYSMPTVFDSRLITSDDKWAVANTSPVDSIDPYADFTELKNFVDPDYFDLLEGGPLGFEAKFTQGRLSTGVFTVVGQFPAGSIMMSPYVQSTGPLANVPLTFIGEINHVPTMTTYVATNASFPIRLVKETTDLTEGQSGTYTGNNGVVYPTICINGKEWLAANLIETNYRNGDNIPEVTADLDWSNNINDLIGQRCSYQNDETNAFTNTIP